MTGTLFAVAVFACVTVWAIASNVYFRHFVVPAGDAATYSADNDPFYPGDDDDAVFPNTYRVAGGAGC